MEVCESGVVALDCEMVGGGSDGSINICARVCLVDEHENVLLNTYVHPLLPVTDYRLVSSPLRWERYICTQHRGLKWQLFFFQV